MSISEDELSLPDPQQQAIDWLVRLRADNLGEGEMFAFADWLSRDNRHAEAFAAAEDLFNDMVMVAHESAMASPVRNDAIKQRMGADTGVAIRSGLANRRSAFKPDKPWFTVSLAIAATWLFAALLVMPDHSHPWADLLSDYHTETGEIREIRLADGSQLLLNTNSAVSVNFDDSTRRITLHHGQVRFTVAKDASRPFEVAVDDLTVRALGTVFEVYNLSPDESGVIVQEHAVSARIDKAEQFPPQFRDVKVEQGHRLRHRVGTALQQPEPVGLEQTSAWQDHRLVVNDRPLGELVTELNRYRSGRIFVAGNDLQQLRVSGVFSLDHPDSTLGTVQQVLGLKQTRLGAWWLVLHR
ncbi:FecR domain-containing protein [Methylomonas sp. LL1]|uniref:FecR family protein n=1 Tax=Methylomonas sp. LL1 TaxID=2785785 RepID=UPI0018C436B5|nr:FecR domain-containing protein [Methylomonas sp. LL1]QPK65110.1 FecR domain-containing protein [Methylomonas sp. LL1]